MFSQKKEEEKGKFHLHVRHNVKTIHNTVLERPN